MLKKVAAIVKFFFLNFINRNSLMDLLFYGVVKVKFIYLYVIVVCFKLIRFEVIESLGRSLLSLLEVQLDVSIVFILG